MSGAPVFSQGKRSVTAPAWISARGVRETVVVYDRLICGLWGEAEARSLSVGTESPRVIRSANRSRRTIVPGRPNIITAILN
jgi:hypothetical protein